MVGLSSLAICAIVAGKGPLPQGNIVATETATKIFTVGFQSLDRGRLQYALPTIERNSVRFVVELKNGKKVSGTVVPGGALNNWRNGTVIMEDAIDLREIKTLGFSSSPGQTPAIFSANGFQVNAFLKGGTQRIIHRSARFHPVSLRGSADYKTLPDVWGDEAVIPTSNVRLTFNVSDGMNRGSVCYVQIETKSGQTYDIRLDNQVDNSFLANNSTSTKTVEVPFLLDPQTFHVARVRLWGGTTGISTDDLSIDSFLLESAGLDRGYDRILKEGNIRLGLKGQSWWQSPVSGKRSLPEGDSMNALTYEILTGADDLRVDGESERVRSRLTLNIGLGNTPFAKADLPTTAQIRNTTNFGANGLCRGPVELPRSMTGAQVFGAVLVPDLGQAGTGFLNTLGADDWDYLGFRLLYTDSKNVQRVLYSEISPRRVSRSGPSTIRYVIGEQSDFVRQTPTRSELPGVRVTDSK